MLGTRDFELVRVSLPSLALSAAALGTLGCSSGALLGLWIAECHWWLMLFVCRLGDTVFSRQRRGRGS